MVNPGNGCDDVSCGSFGSSGQTESDKSSVGEAKSWKLEAALKCLRFVFCSSVFDIFFGLATLPLPWMRPTIQVKEMLISSAIKLKASIVCVSRSLTAGIVWGPVLGFPWISFRPSSHVLPRHGSKLSTSKAIWSMVFHPKIYKLRVHWYMWCNAKINKLRVDWYPNDLTHFHLKR